MSAKEKPRPGYDSALVAEEVMTRNPTTIRPSTTLAQALSILHELDVRHLPVVNEDQELVGMISDRDLRGMPFTFTAEGKTQVPHDAPVADLMSSDVISVELESGIDEIIDLMIDEKVGAVPVVDDRGLLVGIVSYVDLLHELRLAFQ
jgi:acetoin utilization protein AcuB